MLKHLTHTTAAGLALALLGACAGAGVITTDARQSGYDPSLIGDAAGRGGMALEVKGRPFPDDGGRFAEVAARALTEAHRGPAFTVYPDPAAAPDGPLRTVVIANAATAVTPARACTTEVSGNPVAADGTLAVTAALCRGDKAVTRMTGRAAGVSGPDDPKVDLLFRQIARELYPRDNEARREDREGEIWP